MVVTGRGGFTPFTMNAALPLVHDHLRALRLELRALGGCAPSALATLAPKLARALDVDGAFAFSIQQEGDGFRLGHGSEVGTEGVLQTLDALFRSHDPSAWMWLAPPRPSAADRNRVRARDELEGRHDDAAKTLVDALLERFGLTRSGLMRVVVCRGETPLAHVAVFRHGPLGPQHREGLQSLVSPLAERLTRDHAVSEATHVSLQSRLAAIGAPAWLVSSTLHIEHANTAGLAQLERDRNQTLERIRIAVQLRRDAAGLAVTPLVRAGAPVAYLLVQRA
jgi:hypothetical protein